MKYISRNRNSEEDIIEYSNNTLNFLYSTFIGRLFIKLFISKFISDLIGKYMNSKLSCHRIDRFVDKNNINLIEYSKLKYISYNDFFTRKVVEAKRPIASNKELLISPCDSKLTVYKINDDLTLRIKDGYYSIDTLINKEILNEYIDGYALVFRLGVDNYHRYCYIDSGTKTDNVHIKGVYHTVQPITLKKYNFYKTNTREYTILNTNNFGEVIEVEIGAMGVGKIVNLHQEYKYKKGEEKGYFEFGGSTIVLLIKKNIVDMDDDIVRNSKLNIETNVKYGEKIGTRKGFFSKIFNNLVDKIRENI